MASYVTDDDTSYSVWGGHQGGRPADNTDTTGGRRAGGPAGPGHTVGHNADMVFN